MMIKKLAWVGTRTTEAEATVQFVQEVLGLHGENPMPDFWVLTMADGAKVEVFGPEHPHNRHFTTGPVVGFLVENVFAAAEELRAAGVEIVSGPTGSECGGNAWVHFRAPDGNLYEFTQDPGVANP
ncbi:VOC family protein [Kribbella sp. NBC_00889]|uniref:VOC family protein n=1 Tax=Kribbella sp. NBC_00889 TaxID=2975974 RepID=UPI003869E330|nr:VOC family protein [Kribbella sp. NBC_00889]